jgi:hypothetical protein
MATEMSWPERQQLYARAELALSEDRQRVYQPFAAQMAKVQGVLSEDWIKAGRKLAQIGLMVSLALQD